MSILTHRADVAFNHLPNGYLTPQGGSVTAYAPGGVVAQTSTGNTITLYGGHGFIGGEKFMVGVDPSTFSGIFTVASVAGNVITISLGGIASVVVGDVIINLGADNGVSEPSYDGSTVTIYSTPDTTNVIDESRVTLMEGGGFEYWHGALALWELIRGDDGAPIGFNIGVGTDPPTMVNYEIRYAHLFATGGSGTVEDPWVTAGSNPVQAAYDDLPPSGVGGGGTVRMIPGIYSLDGGPNGNGLEITHPSKIFGNVIIEGMSAGGRREVGNSLTYDDAVVLTYSGTGAAIKIGHWATNRSFWCENVTLRGFKLLQTGTSGTGIGIMARLFRFGLFEDLKVNNFNVNIALSGVSDFNEFHNVSSRNMATYGIQLGRATDENGVTFGALGGECNANRFYNCDVLASARNSGVPAWGIYIENNCVANLIMGSQFHDFNTVGYGAIYMQNSGYDSSSTTVENNYFEGNYYNVYHVNSAGAGRNCYGLRILGNWMGQCEGVNVFLNSGSFPGGYTIGALIQGNVFYVPSASAPYDNTVGVVLGSNVINTFLASNAYIVEGPPPTYNPQTFVLPGGNLLNGIRPCVEIVDDSVQWRGQYRSKMVEGSNSEEITLSTSGLTTDSTDDLLPANSVILGVTARIIQSITVTTDWALGDSVQSARFTSPNATKTNNTTSVGLNHLNPAVATANLGPVQTSAAKLRVTCTGSNPGAGKIRVTVFYRTFSAATS